MNGFSIAIIQAIVTAIS